MAAGTRAQITGCAAAARLKQQQARPPPWQLRCCAIGALLLLRRQTGREGLCPIQAAAGRLFGAKPADKMGDWTVKRCFAELRWDCGGTAR